MGAVFYMGNMAARFAFRNGIHLGRFSVVALFLLSFFVSGAWGACGIVQRTTSWYNSQCQSTHEYYVGSSTAYSCTGTYQLNVGSCNKKLSYTIYSSSPIICVGAYNSTFDVYAQYQTCGSQCEVDSLLCVNKGGDWEWKGCELGCVENTIDTTLCDGFRRECEAAQGKFSGSANSGCCIGTCDQCGALQTLVDLKKAMCCNQGLAPPADVRFCTVDARNTCGVNWSTFKSDDNEFECRDPSLDSTVAKTYVEECFEPSSSDSQGGSSESGPGSSSDGGSSSAGPYPEGCDECPWLDSILDTLVLNKWNTDDIVACLTTPGLCAGLTQEPDTFPVFAFDTAFNNYFKPLMDSALKVDSLQLKALMKLDTSILKQLKNDTLSLKNDTTTWHRLDALGNVIDGSITTANDTTRKWFRRSNCSRHSER